MARKAQRGDRAARQAKVRELADALRDGEPTVFAYQGACTHALRSALCLRGWPFALAHREADTLVKAALDMLGAKRPSWAQGQPEWNQEGVLHFQRERCARCARTLPESRYKYCSEVCQSAARADRQRQQYDEEARAARRARDAAWSAKQPERTCPGCGGQFKPKHRDNPDQRFCSARCASRHAGRTVGKLNVF